MYCRLTYRLGRKPLCPRNECGTVRSAFAKDSCSLRHDGLRGFNTSSKRTEGKRLGPATIPAGSCCWALGQQKTHIPVQRFGNIIQVLNSCWYAGSCDSLQRVVRRKCREQYFGDTLRLPFFGFRSIRMLHCRNAEYSTPVYKLPHFPKLGNMPTVGDYFLIQDVILLKYY